MKTSVTTLNWEARLAVLEAARRDQAASFTLKRGPTREDYQTASKVLDLARALFSTNEKLSPRQLNTCITAITDSDIFLVNLFEDLYKTGVFNEEDRASFSNVRNSAQKDIQNIEAILASHTSHKQK